MRKLLIFFLRKRVHIVRRVTMALSHKIFGKLRQVASVDRQPMYGLLQMKRVVKLEGFLEIRALISEFTLHSMA